MYTVWLGSVGGECFGISLGPRILGWAGGAVGVAGCPLPGVIGDGWEGKIPPTGPPGVVGRIPKWWAGLGRKECIFYEYIWRPKEFLLVVLSDSIQFKFNPT